MTNESNQKGGQNIVANLKMTKSMLHSAPSTADMFELPAVRDLWVRTYKRTSGKEDGELRFEAERVMLLQRIAASSALSNCSRESLYSSWIELAISGLTLRDGLSYIMPYRGVAQFMPSWKGRLEQIKSMPNVVHVESPEVVYSSDIFEFEKGMRPIITRHRPTFPRPDNAYIVYAYLVVHYTFGSSVIIMDREEILNIRDNRSQSYKQYLKDMASANEDGKVLKNGSNGQYLADIEKPMWVSDEAQAFRKTVVKRAYNNMDKLPHQKAIDAMILNRAEQNLENFAPGDDIPDPEDFNGPEYADLTSITDDTGVEYAEEVKAHTVPPEVLEAAKNASQNSVHGSSNSNPLVFKAHVAPPEVSWAPEKNETGSF